MAEQRSWRRLVLPIGVPLALVAIGLAILVPAVRMVALPIAFIAYVLLVTSLTGSSGAYTPPLRMSEKEHSYTATMRQKVEGRQAWVRDTYQHGRVPAWVHLIGLLVAVAAVIALAD
jgi:hypothetical protein